MLETIVGIQRLKGKLVPGVKMNDGLQVETMIMTNQFRFGMMTSKDEDWDEEGQGWAEATGGGVVGLGGDGEKGIRNDVATFGGAADRETFEVMWKGHDGGGDAVNGRVAIPVDACNVLTGGHVDEGVVVEAEDSIHDGRVGRQGRPKDELAIAPWRRRKNRHKVQGQRISAPGRPADLDVPSSGQLVSEQFVTDFIHIDVVREVRRRTETVKSMDCPPVRHLTLPRAIASLLHLAMTQFPPRRAADNT